MLTDVRLSTHHALETVEFCPMCLARLSADDVQRRFPPYNIVRCGECATLTLSPRSPETAMEAVYQSEEYWRSETTNGEHGFFDYRHEREAIRRTTRERLAGAWHLFGDHGDRQPLLLEFGGAFGYAALEAESMGFEPRIVELSDTARAEAASLGLLAGPPEVVGWLQAESFDVVMAWETFEHLYEPREFLQECHRLLRPGGVLLLTVPEPGHWTSRLLGSRWWGWRVPEHIFYPTLAGFRHAPPLGGWEVLEDDCVASPQWMTFGGIAARLGRLLPGPAGRLVGRVLTAAVRAARAGDLMARLPHGSVLIALRRMP